MTTLSEQQYQDLILAEVGDDASRVVESTIALYWQRFAAIADLETRSLYVKRACIDLLLGRARKQVTFKDASGATVDLNKLFDHLTTMRNDIDSLIETQSTAASAGGAAGDLTHTAPVMPPSGARVDANDRAYRGDPYRRARRRMP